MPVKSGIIILAGAPDGDTLSWDDESLTANLLPAFSSSDGSTYNQASILAQSLTASTTRPLWRSLPLYPIKLHTGLTPSSDPHLIAWEPEQIPSSDPEAETSFLSITSLDTNPEGNKISCIEDSFVSLAAEGLNEGEDDPDLLTRFLSQSFALHDAIASSQLPADASSPVGDPVSLGEQMIDSDSTSTSISINSGSASPSLKPLPFAATLPLAKIKEIPTAKYVQELRPQTLTVNLVVALISVSQPRTIVPRRTPTRPVQLLELIVGDDTRSGFGINLWLPEPRSHDLKFKGNTGQMRAAEEAFGEMALKIRPRDIVLFKNLALGEWQDMVYGQSLRRGVTRVELLHRSLVDEDDEAGIWNENQLELAGEECETVASGNAAAKQNNTVIHRALEVQTWMHHFVAVGLDSRTAEPKSGAEDKKQITDRGKRRTPPRRSQRLRKRSKVLPPDTQ